MMKKSSNHLFLTWDDLLKTETYQQISDYLGLKQAISSSHEEIEQPKIDARLDECYEWYLSKCTQEKHKTS